ncbi:hypothetical protein M409DRAFT_21300 [Zasmidium cellare ATCC 36951]|uniref:Uncharacterized protein n=1 Tax=Zasmidium cellare ATCC 36951 TaxID=1080233 RepID=A0A6A6CS09_ZASCE|nr:uncharacterized protein M409DRAFT_21300 [Zasmidium cellare ATCC 36951]KAF2168549.1 hypothetical protein M409DRAFT_21300 [Zasmidium cellare ATCC 36951]
MIKLPNLTSLYFHGLSKSAASDTFDLPDGPYDIAEDSCSFEHIFLDNSALGNPHEFRKAVESAPKSLKSLTISASEANDMDGWLSCASETLVLYQTSDLRGYRCNLYRPDELCTLPKNLETAVVDPEDIFLDEYGYRGYGCLYNANNWVEPFQFFTERHDIDYIPSSIETLVLQRPSGRLSEAEADQIDDAIVAILARRSVYYRHCSKCRPRCRNYFPHLKAIYLGALEDEQEYGSKEPRRRVWFQNAIRAGRQQGIDIHTRTTRSRPFHEIVFPTPPNPRDLKFVPESVKEDLRGPRAFDVYSGTWGPPGCGNCGLCSTCLRRYDAAVWKELDKASQR